VKIKKALPYILYAIAHVAFIAWVFCATGALHAESLYERAVKGTSIQPGLLRSIAIVESSERDDVIGDDGLSVGRFQLYEKTTYHEWRAKQWGEYNARNPEQAGRIAARILEFYCQRLRSVYLGIGAYQKGEDKVIESGPNAWYVKRVLKAWAWLIVEEKIKRNTWRGR